VISRWTPSWPWYRARDAIVPVDQGRRLAAHLTAAGNPVAYRELPWSAHGFDAAFHALGHQLLLYELDHLLPWATAPVRPGR
jgi:acetyl esterase/lipase